MTSFGSSISPLIELIEQIVDADLLHADVFVTDADLVLAGPPRIGDFCKIKKNALRSAAGRRQEFADQFGIFNFVSGFFQRFANGRTLCGLGSS